jgi:predicted N-acetyltransferase YhbS
LGSLTLTCATATKVDAAPIAALRTAAAERLTRTVGKGHWSRVVTEEAVRRDLKTARLLVARYGAEIVATMSLATKKPWAIDLAYFTAVPRAVYLHEMAVAPGLQGQGIGRALVREAIAAAREWPSWAIRLDAYDGPAGAGGFYAKCGFRERGPRDIPEGAVTLLRAAALSLRSPATATSSGPLRAEANAAVSNQLRIPASVALRRCASRVLSDSLA